MNLNDLFTEEKVRLDPKCWTGKKIGNPKTKMKGGVRVNNCVPAESVNEMDKSQTPPGRDGSNDSDAGKKEYTAKATTPKKVSQDAEKILNKELNKKQGVAEGEQRVDSIVTDALKIMRGSELSDAVQALKTVLGDREYNSRRGHYNFYVRQILDMYGQQGMAEDQLDEKSTSQAQFRTMAAAAHNPEFAKKVGISRDVAKEFHGADRKQDYADLPKKADEGKSASKEKEADYGDDYQAMVARVKKLAGMGPLKTVYDPARRVYRNVPTAQQPKK
jgi:hypothetical protein